MKCKKATFCLLLGFLLIICADLNNAQKKYISESYACGWFNWNRCYRQKAVPAGDCYRQLSHLNSRKTAKRNSRSSYYTVGCGWFKWRRCGRTRNHYWTTYHTEYYATYSQQFYCCPGYSLSSKVCNPVCSPSCVHGTCIRPNQCQCNSRWTGSICRDDTSLTNWCNSARGNNIQNRHLNSVRSSLTVYCASKRNTYNSGKTKRIAHKVLADINRATSQVGKTVLYELWRHQKVFTDYCCIADTKYYLKLAKQLLAFNTNFDFYVQAMSKTVAIGLRGELGSCSSLSGSFCPMKALLPSFNKAQTLPKIHLWSTRHKEAFTVNLIIMKRKYPSHFSALAISENTILVNNMNLILRYIRANSFNSLSDLAKYWPGNDEYKRNEICSKDYVCIFMKTVQHVRAFIREVDKYNNPPKIGGKVRKIVNTKVDLYKYLVQKQLDRILTILSEQQSTSTQVANHLKQHLTQKFTELKSYFQEVDAFNRRIAQEDIGFIDGRLDTYRSELNQISVTMKRDLKAILESAIAIATGDVIQRTIELAVALIDGLNPLKAIFGGGSLQDIYDAAANLANAIANLAKAVNLHSAFNELRTKTKQISDGFSANDKFLANVKKLIDKKSLGTDEFKSRRDEFLTQYNDYSPKVTKPQIAGLAAFWTTMIDEACEIINGAGTAAGGAGRAVVVSQGLCWKTKVKATEMIELYEEIYDFQFQLMDAMASQMRAENALDAAKAINTEFTEVSDLNPDSGTTLTTLAMIGGLSFVTYKAHIMNAVNLYCNELEYKDGSVKPRECLGPRTDLTLLTSVTKTECTSETHEYFHDVPIKQTGQNDEAHMNLSRLYSGEPIYFKIPNSQWLVDQAWIVSSEKEFAFYVKQFEVFLPTASSFARHVRVRALPITNEVVPGGTDYSITPSSSLVYEYKEGPSNTQCRSTRGKHPYMACKTSGYNEICHLTVVVNRIAYPSLFARWKITVSGYESAAVPDPANNDLTLKIGLRLCKLAKGPYVAAAVRKQSSRSCCPSDKYKSDVRSSQCKYCPANSHPVLAGYYCEKN